MNKHTPGPWRSIRGPTINTVSVVGPSFIGWDKIEDADRGFWISCTRYDTANNQAQEEVISNANLIAAAPEMLEALHAIDQAIADNPLAMFELIPAETRILMDVAFAKAGGRQ